MHNTELLLLRSYSIHVYKTIIQCVRVKLQNIFNKKINYYFNAKFSLHHKYNS